MKFSVFFLTVQQQKVCNIGRRLTFLLFFQNDVEK